MAETEKSAAIQLDKTLAGIAFRASRPEHTDIEESAEMSRKKPGRFNTSAVGALYLSREPGTALREFQDGSGESDDDDPCVISVVSLAIERCVDLDDPIALESCGLCKGDLTADDLVDCQRAAERLAASGAEGVIWPSATGKGKSLALFWHRLSDKSRVELKRVIELPRDEPEDYLKRLSETFSDEQLVHADGKINEG